MKQILLIDREFGASGTSIGETLASRLCWQLFDDTLSQEIARLAKIPADVCRRREERRSLWPQRLANLIWREAFDRNFLSADLAVLDTDRLVSMVQKVIEQAAEKKPCIIVGRGAAYFLRERKDTLSVFLYTSRDLKYRRVPKRMDGNEKEAVELLDTQDVERRMFVKHYLGREWPDRQLFHAMFNTDIGVEKTVDAIVHLVDAINWAEEAAKA